MEDDSHSSSHSSSHSRPHLRSHSRSDSKVKDGKKKKKSKGADNFIEINFDEYSDISDDERKAWSGQCEFALTSVGFVVGLGNLWRFPHICYTNGGGVFLIPYAIFLVLFGIPLFFIEAALGQFSSLSMIAFWKQCPLFKGVGYGMMVMSFVVCFYYAAVCSWALFYVFASMSAELPWKGCDHEWNTPNCVSDFVNLSKLANTSLAKLATEEYFEYEFLQKTSGIHELGTLRWPLFMCLIVVWVLTFIYVLRANQSLGKVVYVTTVVTYLLFALLLARGLTLDGAMKGISYYVLPDLKKLSTWTVWFEAANQVFFSLGNSWGAVHTLASYNKFNNNVYRDSILVPVVDFLTSFIAGLTIFSVLGFMSELSGKPVSEVATSGTGLVFVVYPTAMMKMPLEKLWSTLFFLMIFGLGLTTFFVMFVAVTVSFTDEYNLTVNKKKRAFIITATAFSGFLLSVPMVFQSGYWWVLLVNYYSAVFGVFLFGVLECVVISWIYGVDRFMKDIQLMIGHRLPSYWKYMLKYITPAVVLVIYIVGLVVNEWRTYDGYTYPTWSVLLGWVMGLASVVPIPVVALYAIFQKRNGSFLQRLLHLCQPSAEFGPSDPANRELYFASFDEFDWLRYKAVLASIDWRTYKENGGDGAPIRVEKTSSVSILGVKSVSIKSEPLVIPIMEQENELVDTPITKQVDRETAV